jgi:AcrR family transcriptional regulator
VPRTTKGETRKKIQDAVVAECVEKGFGSFSVAGVVERAKVSAGSIYVHFDDKDEMLRQTYIDIKSEFHQKMLAAKAETSSRMMIRRMWFDTFEFVAERPDDFLFLEYGSVSQFLTEKELKIVKSMYGEIVGMIKRGVDDGTLQKLDPKILSVLLVAPAMQLARSALLQNITISNRTKTETFDCVWRSISIDPN